MIEIGNERIVSEKEILTNVKKALEVTSFGITNPHQSVLDGVSNVLAKALDRPPDFVKGFLE